MSSRLIQHIMIAFLFIMIGLSSEADASPMRHVSESNLHVSRYVESTPGPTEAQFNPLHVVIPRVRFGSNVYSIGQAINVLLIDTGYRLARQHPDKRVEQILKLRLPDIQRNMGPLTLEQALKTLVSSPWILSVDPVHRLISYELPYLYRSADKAHKVIHRKPYQATQKRQVHHKKYVKPTAKKRMYKARRKYKPTKDKWKDINETLFGVTS